MTTFDRAALDALPIAPGVTGAIRERAFDQFQALPTPSPETEEWRYTDLSDFALDYDHVTCEGPRPARPGARTLLDAACALGRSHVFSSVLTPNYNEGHRDHFHVDARPDDPRFFLR